jgi:hypothetical protein
LFYSPNQATNGLQSKQSGRESSFVKFDTKSVLFSCKDKIEEVLKKFLKKFKLDLINNEKNRAMCTLFGLNSLRLDDTSDDDKILADFNVLYEKADFNSKKKYFVRFDVNETLEECLRNKTVIEFPSLYLVKSEHLSQFDIQIEDRREAKVTDPASASSSPVSVDDKIVETEAPKKAEHVFEAPKPVVASCSTRIEDGEVEDGELDDDDDDEPQINYENSSKKVKLDSN